jgi:hypothetical protein
MKSAIFLLCSIPWFATQISANAGAATLLVPGDFPEIQAAINQAQAGDSVLVSPGTYPERLDFHGKSITVTGTDPEDWGVVSATVVDGEELRASVVRFHAGEPRDAVLAGLTLTAGRGTIVFQHSFNYSTIGGGIHCESSSPTLKRLIIKNNRATGLTGGGGGVVCRFGAAPLIEECIIRDNKAIDGAEGSGILIEGSSPILRDCEISDNEADAEGGGISIRGGLPEVDGCTLTRNSANSGGGIYLRASSALVTNCRIENNDASYRGSGINVYSASPTILDCVIQSNGQNRATHYGGGISLQWADDAQIDHCTIAFNRAQLGGALHNTADVPVLTSATIVGNTSTSGDYPEPIANEAWDPLLIQESIVWGNSATGLHGNFEVTWSDIEGGWPGEGNIDADPRFCEVECPHSADLGLAYDSPCIGAGPEGGDLGSQGPSCEEPRGHTPRTLLVPVDFSKVENAIFAACDGDTVEVAPGSYYEPNLSCRGKRLVLRSIDPEDPQVVESTVLNVHHDGRGFRFVDGETRKTKLAGFTIRGAWLWSGNGAGIECSNSSPTIEYCHIIDNACRTTYGGAGIACHGDAAPLIRDCLIADNHTEEDGSGGGVFSVNSSPELVRCTIRGNTAKLGGGIYGGWPEMSLESCVIESNEASADGGGAYLLDDALVIATHCDFDSNTAGETAGGIYLQQSTLQLKHSRVRANGADSDAGNRGGGGLLIDSGGVAELSNCIVADNAAEGNGAGLMLDGNGCATLGNCALAGNVSHGEGGAVYSASDTTAALHNCIAWNNPPQSLVAAAESELSADWCDIQGGWPGTGNLDLLPRFRSLHGYDYLLKAGSPCIDAGNPTIEDQLCDQTPGWPARYTNGRRSDMGTYGGPENGGWLE